MKRFLLLLFVSVSLGASPLLARDVFVVLSGGVSPFNNNYSQYLQAKALNAYFEKNYPADSVWTFFGAGNVEGGKPLLADVKRKVHRNDLVLDSWLPGPIPHNLSAQRDVVLKTFREQILPAVAKGGTLYLFVGDHGSRPSRAGESQIDLWAMKSDPRNANGWRYETNAALGVAEFRKTLTAGLGKGKVVFCMTQCHSGGFHSLAMPNEMMPNRDWFTRVPDWTKVKSKTVTTFPRVAGFTATDEFSLASGCDPDPDPDKWAGYERFIPENLLGMDLFTREITHAGLRSFAEAHVAATLEDFTIDKPASSSDDYLKRWADVLDGRLARELNLTGKVRTALAAYQRAVDGAVQKNSDAAFRERQGQFARFIEKMGDQNSGAKKLLLTGTKKQLEEAIGLGRRTNSFQSPRDLSNQSPSRTNSPPSRTRGGGGVSPETRKLWKESLRPLWAKAVASGEVTNLVSLPLPFEKHLLKLETDKDRYFFSGGRMLDEEVYWFSGYGKPESVDHAKAEANARWSLERRKKIIAWAEASADKDVRAAAKKLSAKPTTTSTRPATDAKPAETKPTAPVADSHQSLSKKTAAERTLYYRRVLGAWEFLLAVNERSALKRLQELIELERTPLPPVKSR